MRSTFKYILLAAVAAGGVFWFTPSCKDLEEARMDNGDQAWLPETTENALIVLNNDMNPHATPADSPMDSMPDDGCIRLRVSPPPGPLARVLNDSNYLHYDAARELGINPITSDNSAWNVSKPIMRIRSCREFYVAELTHSYPYLVPEASKLLHEIGRRFNDTLAARGGGDYRLKVTSLLRTTDSVHKLRRLNRCAVDSSAHQFGTTFDISYTRFMLTSDTGVHRTQEDLKNLLAEILNDVRDEGRCYVKYERKSGCMHVTTRPEKTQ